MARDRTISIPAQPIEDGNLVLLGNADDGPLAVVLPMAGFALIVRVLELALAGTFDPDALDPDQRASLEVCVQTVAKAQTNALGPPEPVPPRRRFRR